MLHGSVNGSKCYLSDVPEGVCLNLATEVMNCDSMFELI